MLHLITCQGRIMPRLAKLLFDKVLLNEILKAAVWNQSSTFAKFYLRDMSQQLPNLHHLGPVVVAQKVCVCVWGGGGGGEGPS